MPDKRALDGPDDPPSPKRVAPPAGTDAASQDSGVIAILQHPRIETGTSDSPFTAPPVFQQPAPLCSFSFDEHRKLWHDDRSKRFYRGPPPYDNRHPYQSRAPPVFGADLNYGLDRFVRRDESVPEHLDALVAALQHRTESGTSSAERSERDQERRRAHVVTWRGILTKLCTAYHQSPHERFTDPLELNAMLLDNTLYLEEYTSPTARADKQRKDDDAKMLRLGYYGYAFESYCTVDDEAGTRAPFRGTTSRGPAGWSGDVNTNVQWCQVVRTKLGAHRLVLGGEVDAVERNPATGREEMVELKTSMQLTPFQRNFGKARSDQERFEKKLLKFFLQSYLLGIGKIVVGFRDHHGMLTTHQPFETLRIPRMVRAGQPIAGQTGPDGRTAIRQHSVWEPKDSLGFGDQIISFIRHTLERYAATPAAAEDGSSERADENADAQPARERIRHPVFRVTYKAPFDHVEIRALSDAEALEQAQDNNASGERVGFLPRSFYDFVMSRAGSDPPA